MANLKACKANVIPTMVTVKITALIKLAIANSNPPKTTHNIFKRKVPPESFTVTTSLPKGANCNYASLKHWRPIGIPIIVILQRTPKKHQIRALTKPPQINQIKLPRHDIFSPPFSILCNCTRVYFIIFLTHFTRLP